MSENKLCDHFTLKWKRYRSQATCNLSSKSDSTRSESRDSKTFLKIFCDKIFLRNNICDKHYSDNYLVTKIIMEQNWWQYCLFKKIFTREKTNFVTNNFRTNYYDKIFIAKLNLLTNANRSRGRTNSRAWEPNGWPLCFLNKKHSSVDLDLKFIKCKNINIFLKYCSI